MKHTILSDDQCTEILMSAEIRGETELGMVKFFDITMNTDSMKGNYVLMNSCESDRHVLIQRLA